jgi:hypothetical protein
MKTLLLSASALAVSLGAFAAFVPAAPQDRKGEKKPAELTELASTGWATLTGSVTYDGTPPSPKLIKMSGSKDEKNCRDGATERELVDQKWLVNKENKGISDAIIFIKPPEGKFFKIHPSYMQKAKKPIELRQPHCVFIPHSFVYWASYYDKESREQKPSGQQLRIVNDSKFNHNIAWLGDEDINPKGSLTLPPGASRSLKFIAQDTPVRFKSDIHPWMSANCWALDTPYAARTDENGKFTIENVPAGVEVHVVMWHEAAGFLFGQKGKAMTLKDGGEHGFHIKMKPGR